MAAVLGVVTLASGFANSIFFLIESYPATIVPDVQPYTTQSNFYLQVQPVSDTIHYEQLQGVLLEDPIDVISNILPVVNISNSGKVILNIREYLQLIHFGYVSNYGLKLEVINTSNPFNLYSLYSHSSLIDSLNPELLIHYVSP